MTWLPYIQDIHKELPAIVAKLRVIWNLCPSYGTIEPFTTLLRRISNEIIKTCTQSPLLFNAVLDSPRSCANHIQVAFCPLLLCIYKSPMHRSSQLVAKAQYILCIKGTSHHDD